MGKLDGKVALVTGASRGIGQAIAELFAREGASVACTARTLKEGDHPSLKGSLEGTLSAIEAAGGKGLAVACDVSEYEQCQEAVAQTREALGPIDVLVNNAALTYFIPVAKYPVAKWQRSLAVNFNGPFYMAQLCLSDMIERGSGAIVNISSSAAIGPGRGPYKQGMRAMGGGGTLYGAEKAALERFTQGLAAEVYSNGISVTCLSPSMVVATPGVLHHGLVRDENSPFAEPVERMAEAALELATRPLDEITGRVTYSQQLLVELGLLEKGRGVGIDRPGSGYSQI